MNHAEAWKAKRRRGQVFVLWWLGGPFGVGLGFVLIAGLLGQLLSPPQRKSLEEVTFHVLGLVWLVGTAIAGFQYVHWPCPRCGKPFLEKWTFANPLTSRCLHCGLKQGATEEEAKAADGRPRS